MRNLQVPPRPPKRQSKDCLFFCQSNLTITNKCPWNSCGLGYSKKLLQERFNVSYNRADSIVRTEMAHIQTQAAKQRYADAGLEEVEVWADKDERRCDVCGKLHQKRFPIGANMPIPAHPRCRWCILPVVEDSEPEPQVEIKEPPEKKVDNPKSTPTPAPQPAP